MNSRRLLSFERMMIFSALLSFGFLFYRCIFAENFHYTFLLWNMLIAFLPYIISKKLVSVKENSFASYLLLFGWLVFFPACIYPLADVLHMQQASNFSFVYDAIMFFSFAVTGLLPGLISLKNVETFLKKHTSGLLTKLSVVFFIALSSYSACVVRFLHLKSWNVLSDFKRMYAASIRDISDPLAHFRIWAYLIVLVLAIDVMYAVFKRLSVKSRRLKY